MGNGNRGNTMIIKNGLVFTPEGKFEKKDLYVEGEYVAKETTDNKEVEAEGCYVIPGLVDIHFHGCVRHDMCDGTEESIQALADYEAANGVLAICPATMTIPEEELFQAMKAAKEHKNGKGADLVGINMEGPFINKEKKGAQKEEDIKLADIELFHKLQEAAGGLIKLVDLAPETEGAMDFIDQVKDEVHVSIAHTMADYDTASEAIRRGADHITHLYNAMPPLNHREPGVIGAARDSDCYVELICDGVHIHPSCVRATFEMFTDKRIVLISDSMMATGMEDGQYELGGQPVTVVGNLATLTEGGAIAGWLRLKLEGLDPDAKYQVSCDLTPSSSFDTELVKRYGYDTVGNQVKTYEAYGDELMRAGIPVDRQDLNKKGGDFASLLYTIKKVD